MHALDSRESQRKICGIDINIGIGIPIWPGIGIIQDGTTVEPDRNGLRRAWRAGGSRVIPKVQYWQQAEVTMGTGSSVWHGIQDS